MAEFPDWEDKKQPPCCSEGDALPLLKQWTLVSNGQKKKMSYTDCKWLDKKIVKFYSHSSFGWHHIWMYNTLHTGNKAVICEVPLDCLIFTIFRVTPAVTVFHVVDYPERENEGKNGRERITVSGATSTSHLQHLHSPISHYLKYPSPTHPGDRQVCTCSYSRSIFAAATGLNTHLHQNHIFISLCWNVLNLSLAAHRHQGTSYFGGIFKVTV